MPTEWADRYANRAAHNRAGLAPTAPGGAWLHDRIGIDGHSVPRWAIGGLIVVRAAVCCRPVESQRHATAVNSCGNSFISTLVYRCARCASSSVRAASRTSSSSSSATCSTHGHTSQAYQLRMLRRPFRHGQTGCTTSPGNRPRNANHMSSDVSFPVRTLREPLRRPRICAPGQLVLLDWTEAGSSPTGNFRAWPVQHAVAASAAAASAAASAACAESPSQKAIYATAAVAALAVHVEVRGTIGGTLRLKLLARFSPPESTTIPSGNGKRTQLCKKVLQALLKVRLLQGIHVHIHLSGTFHL